MVPMGPALFDVRPVGTPGRQVVLEVVPVVGEVAVVALGHVEAVQVVEADGHVPRVPGHVHHLGLLLQDTGRHQREREVGLDEALLLHVRHKLVAGRGHLLNQTLLVLFALVQRQHLLLGLVVHERTKSAGLGLYRSDTN